MLNSVGFYQVWIIGQTSASLWCAFFLFVSGSYCCSCDVDFQAEHDSSCLCHGMDTSWQALLKRSEDGCGCSCCRSGCLYSDGCKSECEGFCLCLHCSLIYIVATNCEYIVEIDLLIFIDIFFQILSLISDEALTLDAFKYWWHLWLCFCLLSHIFLFSHLHDYYGMVYVPVHARLIPLIYTHSCTCVRAPDSSDILTHFDFCLCALKELNLSNNLLESR